MPLVSHRLELSERHVKGTSGKRALQSKVQPMPRKLLRSGKNDSAGLEGDVTRAETGEPLGDQVRVDKRVDPHRVAK
jgi:hypothetical protein